MHRKPLFGRGGHAGAVVVVSRIDNIPFKDMASGSFLSCFGVVALSHLIVMSWTLAYSRFGALRVRVANRFLNARIWRDDCNGRWLRRLCCLFRMCDAQNGVSKQPREERLAHRAEWMTFCRGGSCRRSQAPPIGCCTIGAGPGRVFAASPRPTRPEIGGVLIKGSPSCWTLLIALLVWSA